MKKLFAALALCALAGCATTGTGTATPQTQIFAIKANYDAALQVALIYDNLPACGSAATAVCSTLAVKQKIDQAKNVASPAIQAAENAVRTPGFDTSTTSAIVASANAAVLALTAITAALNVK